MHLSEFSPDQLIASLVSEYEKKPVTTSLIVAEFFGKQHKNMLQSIELDSVVTR